MARISELHYSNAYAASSGVPEFLEVALGPSDNPADFTVSFYQADGSLGNEFVLTDPGITSSIDPDNGEVIFVLSAANLPIFLTDPDGGGATNYEAYALTDTTTVPGTVIDFYDIGGGTQNIVASGGAAAGATSTNIPTPTGPQTTTTSIQFNQPNPDTVVYESVGPGDTGIACFTAGTRIRTDRGGRLIERLRPGDWVATLDNGYQQLLWIGQRTVDARGDLAPIRIRKGAFGARTDVLVSPQHRILVKGWQAELYFGKSEVLIPAKALLNDKTVVRAPQDCVTYIHLLFDAHQILETQGLLSESYLPGGAMAGESSPMVEEEIAQLFPEICTPAPSEAKAARYLCTVKEAQALPQSVLVTL